MRKLAEFSKKFQSASFTENAKYGFLSSKTGNTAARSSIRLAIHLSRNVTNEKCIAGYFAPFFSHFAPLFLLFVFCSISHLGRHSCENLKDFLVYFFAALIKHEICLQCEKCIVSVSHFVVCFAKTFTKYLQNVKYEKCIASLRMQGKRSHGYESYEVRLIGMNSQWRYFQNFTSDSYTIVITENENDIFFLPVALLDIIFLHIMMGHSFMDQFN